MAKRSPTIKRGNKIPVDILGSYAYASRITKKTPIPFTPALDIPTMIDASIENIIGKNSTERFKLLAKINI